MAYTVTSDSVGLAIGQISETANDVHEALCKAWKVTLVFDLRSVRHQALRKKDKETAAKSTARSSGRHRKAG